MRMIIRIKRIRRRGAQRNIAVREILPMVHERRRAPHIANHDLAVPGKTARRVAARARLAHVVGGWAADDDVRALGRHELRGGRQVGRVGLYDDAGGRGAGFGTRAHAVGTAVVGGR